METLIFGDSEQSRLAFLVLSGFGLMFAITVYALLAHPGARNARLKALKAVSKTYSALAGASVLLIFVLGAYHSHYSGFFEARLQPDRLQLVYRWPTRTVSVERSDIKTILHRSTPTKSGSKSSLVIVTRAGEHYESSALTSARHQPLRQQLESWQRASP